MKTTPFCWNFSKTAEQRCQKKPERAHGLFSADIFTRSCPPPPPPPLGAAVKFHAHAEPSGLFPQRNKKPDLQVLLYRASLSALMCSFFFSFAFFCTMVFSGTLRGVRVWLGGGGAGEGSCVHDMVCLLRACAMRMCLAVIQH